jgi:hypothetical protein
MLISSLSFAAGHVYQSWTWAAIQLGYVPLMFSIARKHGLGTIMAGHVTYDLISYLFLLIVSGKLW